MKAFSLRGILLLLAASRFLCADVIDSSLILRLNFDTDPVGGVVNDTSPAGGHPGSNVSATWVATEDGRSGVMNFDGTVPGELSVEPAADLNSSTGAITFWMKSSLVTANPSRMRLFSTDGKPRAEAAISSVRPRMAA